MKSRLTENNGCHFTKPIKRCEGMWKQKKKKKKKSKEHVPAKSGRFLKTRKQKIDLNLKNVIQQPIKIN